MPRCEFVCLTTMLVAFGVFTPSAAAGIDLEAYKRTIEPILVKHCYDCHGDGNQRGGLALDDLSSRAAFADPSLWVRMLKAVRLGLMPPVSEDRLPATELETLLHFIKREALALDPKNPDPGRITIRRLNRVEYRNSVRDLLGVDFDAAKDFPADDTGHGFDNIADVLTISPMLLEKYLDAAQAIVTRVVPVQPRTMAERKITGEEFKPTLPAQLPFEVPLDLSPPPAGSRDLFYYAATKVTGQLRVKVPGRYKISGDLKTVERYHEEPDFNRCQLRFLIDNEPVWQREFAREGDKLFSFSVERELLRGNHSFAFELVPLAPSTEQRKLLRIRLNAVTLRGPTAPKHWVTSPGYERFFPRPVPVGKRAQRQYAREILGAFATRAFRRPVDRTTSTRLAALAEEIWTEPGSSFEAGVAQAMVAVLASPRFIFKEEATLPLHAGQVYPLIDEYALASRLSYFLWSSMPDKRLIRLARLGRLRARLIPEFERMLADPRADEFVRNFAGQWLQARDILGVDINALAVYMREHPDPEAEKARLLARQLNQIPDDKITAQERAQLAAARQKFRSVFRAPKPMLTTSLRQAMQAETELSFGHVIKENRSLLELIDSNYTFLNQELANHYGIEGVQGKEMRKVDLPANSPRGGVLTQGTVLAVTSNPTRTSPVKRGVFILNAILGTPPAPPPPNIPSLEDVASKEALQNMSLRQALDLHARNPLCRSCHNRMDPLGLALENFNALGMWRESDLNLPVEPAGTLVTGENFANVQELKHVLAKERKQDFFFNMAEKFFTYALGRGVQASDVDTIEGLVAELERAQGRPRPLLEAIVLSAPFQASRVRQRGEQAQLNVSRTSKRQQ